jgi:dTDP-4-dehydrorhamnose reductase
MRILVTGASGYLGSYLLRELHGSADEVTAWSGTSSAELFGVRAGPVDLASPPAVREAFRQARPDLILHAAALARPADCQRDSERARRINAEGTAVLAELAELSGSRLLLVSTDLVFDGEQGWYREQDVPSPLSVYGRSKVAAETVALAVPRGAVIRVSLLFGPSLTGRPSFFDEQVTALRIGRPITLFTDEWRTSLSLVTAARALVSLARSDFTGLLHLGGPQRLSRLEMGQRLAAFLGADPSTLVASNRTAAASAEPRPRDTSLDSSRWRSLFPGQPWPNLEEALGEMRLG